MLRLPAACGRAGGGLAPMAAAVGQSNDQWQHTPRSCCPRWAPVRRRAAAAKRDKRLLLLLSRRLAGELYSLWVLVARAAVSVPPSAGHAAGCCRRHPRAPGCQPANASAVAAVAADLVVTPAFAKQLQIRPHAWRDCAVVGGSLTVLGRGMGARIDRASTVVRVNMHPTAGFERDVGNRTTVAFIAGKPRSARVRRWLRSPRTASLVFPPKNSEAYADTVAQLSAAPALPANVTVALMHPFFLSVAAQLGVSRPSSGFMAVLLARQMCTATAVYGFTDRREGSSRHCAPRPLQTREPSTMHRPSPRPPRGRRYRQEGHRLQLVPFLPHRARALRAVGGAVGERRRPRRARDERVSRLVLALRPCAAGVNASRPCPVSKCPSTARSIRGSRVTSRSPKAGRGVGAGGGPARGILCRPARRSPRTSRCRPLSWRCRRARTLMSSWQARGARMPTQRSVCTWKSAR